REVYNDFTLVELELKTGRTHQIRVHLSHIGYPIAGDDMYGGRHLTVREVAGDEAKDAVPGFATGDVILSRQALHASLLGVTHPMTNEPRVFQAPLHADMAQLVQLLRRHRFVAAPNVAGATIDLDAML